MRQSSIKSITSVSFGQRLVFAGEIFNLLQELDFPSVLQLQSIQLIPYLNILLNLRLNLAVFGLQL
jgi:hypothetical protein